MTRNELAERLRWLADEWRAATPRRRIDIELAFRRGLERGEGMLG